MLIIQGRSAYRVHELVQDLVELIPVLGHEKCVLVSHDWGAFVAWAFAAQHAVRSCSLPTAGAFALPASVGLVCP